jgi:hypothetical protein
VWNLLPGRRDGVPQRIGLLGPAFRLSRTAERLLLGREEVRSLQVASRLCSTSVEGARMRGEDKMARQTRRSSGRKKISGKRGTQTKQRRGRPASRATKRNAKSKNSRKNSRSKSKRSTRGLSKRHTRSSNPRGKADATTIAEPISEMEDLEAVESATEQARRAAESMVGDELPGGTVAVPDNDRVDDWAGALGVERSPDSPVRTSAEILDSRDRRRPGRHPEPKL